MHGSMFAFWHPLVNQKLTTGEDDKKMYKPVRRALSAPVWVLMLSAFCAGSASAEVPELTSEMEQAFSQAGWDAERSSDGSLILRHGSAAKAAAEAAKKPQVKSAESDMWERLRGMGWRVETDADGATLLYPPSKKKAPAKAVAATARGRAKTADKSLDELLEERGWRVERSSDGSLILYPQAEESAPEQSAKAAIEPAEGFVPSTTEVAEIDMPVDKWSEARRIAAAWLKVFGNDELHVVKIRKVLRVYLVSIVEARPPHSLSHQIAINTSDGRVVVLN